MRGFFVSQMATYVACHRSPINRATHFAGIPMIIFGILLQLAPWRVPLGDDGISVALPVAAGARALWIALAPSIGLAMGCFLVPAVAIAELLAGRWPVGTVTLPRPASSSPAGSFRSPATSSRAAGRRWSATSFRPSSARCS